MSERPPLRPVTQFRGLGNDPTHQKQLESTSTPEHSEPSKRAAITQSAIKDHVRGVPVAQQAQAGDVTHPTQYLRQQRSELRESYIQCFELELHARVYIVVSVRDPSKLVIIRSPATELGDRTHTLV